MASLVWNRVLVKEHQREQSDTLIIALFAKGQLERVLKGLDDLQVGCIVVEDGNSTWESCDWRERSDFTFRKLVAGLVGLESLPVSQIEERNKLLDTAGAQQIQVALAVLGDLLLASHGVFKGAVGDQVTFVLLIKELNWNVALQVDDASILQAEVEVLLLATAEALQYEVLGELSRLVCGLEKIVLTVKLHIPSDGEDLMRFIVDHVELEQSFNVRLVDILQPDFFAEVQLELSCLLVPHICILDIRAALYDHVVTILPRLVKLIEALVQSAKLVELGERVLKLFCLCLLLGQWLDLVDELLVVVVEVVRSELKGELIFGDAGRVFLLQ